MTKEEIQIALDAIPVLTTEQYKEFLNVDITSKTISDEIIDNYYSQYYR